jgi:prolipoprotein diacylglyceryltransferase
VIGRIIYGLTHFQEFGFNVLKYLLANGYPGISASGMVLGWVGVMYWACKVRKIKFLEFSDYIAPSLFIFTLAAELGAFIAGTEPGVLWKWFRHPVAIYKALFLGALLTESPVEYWAFLILLLTSCFYFVYYFRVLLISSIKTFINSKTNYVKKIVKNISYKPKNNNRGGTKKTNTSDTGAKD